MKHKCWRVILSPGLIAGLLLSTWGSEARGAEWPSEAERDALRTEFVSMLGIPVERVDLAPEFRGTVDLGDIVIEKWVITTEPGSRAPLLLYRPAEVNGKLPAIVLVYGHGSSKSDWAHQYAGQLYARAGLVCVAMDPIGEEERNLTGAMGSRAHDDTTADARAAAAGRLVMGKLVFDAMRVIDWLETRADIDAQRIGVAGYSLGGAVGSWLTVTEPRLRMALVCGWAYDDIVVNTKLCTKAPNQKMRALCDWVTYASLAAPHCAVLIANGNRDVVIDKQDDGTAWRGTDAVVARVRDLYAQLGKPGWIATWYEDGAGHRPYFNYKVGLEWIHEHLGTPHWSVQDIRDLPTLNAGEYCLGQGLTPEPHYFTPLHWAGATLPDVGVRHLSREVLAVLREEERGAPAFTFAGWLDQIEKTAAGR